MSLTPLYRVYHTSLSGSIPLAKPNTKFFIFLFLKKIMSSTENVRVGTKGISHISLQFEIKMH